MAERTDLEGVLGHVYEPVPDDLARLRARLATRADADGLLDVAYRTVDSPVGELLVAATTRGVVRVAFAAEGEDAVLQELAALVSPRILAAPRRLDPVAGQLAEYFAGRRRVFDLPLDWQLAHGFGSVVLHQLSGIGYGRTATYAQVAGLTGNPRAVRAVGTACARNPIPLLVPCHRVVRSDGTPGGYRGGPAAKRALLELEAGR